MIINLKRGAVKQEEDSWVLAAVPRYTIKLLCKCLASHVIPLFTHVCEVVALIYMLWVGAVRMEMSKISPKAMGITAFLSWLQKICIAFLSRIGKKPSRTGNHHLNENHAEGESEAALYRYSDILRVFIVWWSVMCLNKSQKAKVKARETVAAWPWERANIGLFGLLASWKEAWNGEQRNCLLSNSYSVQGKKNKIRTAWKKYHCFLLAENIGDPKCSS